MFCTTKVLVAGGGLCTREGGTWLGGMKLWGCQGFYSTFNPLHATAAHLAGGVGVGEVAGGKGDCK